MFLVLHPRHKLEYFKKRKWEGAWIQAARGIVQEEFSRSYQLIEGQDDDDDVEDDGNEVVSIIRILSYSLG